MGGTHLGCVTRVLSVVDGGSDGGFLTVGTGDSGRSSLVVVIGQVASSRQAVQAGCGQWMGSGGGGGKE